MKTRLAREEGNEDRSRQGSFSFRQNTIGQSRQEIFETVVESKVPTLESQSCTNRGLNGLGILEIVVGVHVFTQESRPSIGDGRSGHEVLEIVFGVRVFTQESLLNSSSMEHRSCFELLVMFMSSLATLGQWRHREHTVRSSSCTIRLESSRCMQVSRANQNWMIKSKKRDDV